MLCITAASFLTGISERAAAEPLLFGQPVGTRGLTVVEPGGPVPSLVAVRDGQPVVAGDTLVPLVPSSQVGTDEAQQPRVGWLPKAAALAPALPFLLLRSILESSGEDGDDSTPLGDLTAGYYGLRQAQHGLFALHAVHSIESGNEYVESAKRMWARAEAVRQSAEEARLEGKFLLAATRERLADENQYDAERLAETGLILHFGGQLSLAKNAHRIAYFSAKNSAIPMNPAAAELMAAETFGQGLLAWLSDPMRSTRSVVLRSLPTSSLPILGGVAGFAVAGPKGAAGGAFVAGAAAEFGASAAEGIQTAAGEDGVSLADPEAIVAWVEANPEKVEEIAINAAIRAGIIGGAGAVGAWGSGTLVKAVGKGSVRTHVAVSSAGVGIETVTDGVAEATAGLVTEGTYLPGDVLAEMIGGGAQGGATTAGMLLVEHRGGATANDADGLQDHGVLPQAPVAEADVGDVALVIEDGQAVFDLDGPGDGPNAMSLTIKGHQVHALAFVSETGAAALMLVVDGVPLQAVVAVPDGHEALLDVPGLAARLGVSCFVGGTLVWTETGARPIEEVKAGDFVWSRADDDAALGSPVVLRRVRSVAVTKNQETLRLLLRTVSGDEDELGVTANHRMYSQRRGFVPAGRLEVGEHLLDPEGRSVEVVALGSSGKRETVYNFDVDGFHTYFVGSERVWTHNQYGADNGNEGNGDGTRGEGPSSIERQPAEAGTLPVQDVGFPLFREMSPTGHLQFTDSDGRVTRHAYFEADGLIVLQNDFMSLAEGKPDGAGAQWGRELGRWLMSERERLQNQGITRAVMLSNADTPPQQLDLTTEDWELVPITDAALASEFSTSGPFVNKKPQVKWGPFSWRGKTYLPTRAWRHRHRVGVNYPMVIAHDDWGKSLIVYAPDGRTFPRRAANVFESDVQANEDWLIAQGINAVFHVRRPGQVTGFSLFNSDGHPLAGIKKLGPEEGMKELNRLVFGEPTETEDGAAAAVAALPEPASGTTAAGSETDAPEKERTGQSEAQVQLLPANAGSASAVRLGPPLNQELAPTGYLGYTNGAGGSTRHPYFEADGMLAVLLDYEAAIAGASDVDEAPQELSRALINRLAEEKDGLLARGISRVVVLSGPNQPEVQVDLKDPNGLEPLNTEGFVAGPYPDDGTLKPWSEVESPPLLRMEFPFKGEFPASHIIEVAVDGRMVRFPSLIRDGALIIFPENGSAEGTLPQSVVDRVRTMPREIVRKLGQYGVGTVFTVSGRSMDNFLLAPQQEPGARGPDVETIRDRFAQDVSFSQKSAFAPKPAKLNATLPRWRHRSNLVATHAFTHRDGGKVLGVYPVVLQTARSGGRELIILPSAKGPTPARAAAAMRRAVEREPTLRRLGITAVYWLRTPNEVLGLTATASHPDHRFVGLDLSELNAQLFAETPNEADAPVPEPSGGDPVTVHLGEADLSLTPTTTHVTIPSNPAPEAVEARRPGVVAETLRQAAERLPANGQLVPWPSAQDPYLREGRLATHRFRMIPSGDEYPLFVDENVLGLLPQPGQTSVPTEAYQALVVWSMVHADWLGARGVGVVSDAVQFFDVSSRQSDAHRAPGIQAFRDARATVHLPERNSQVVVRPTDAEWSAVPWRGGEIIPTHGLKLKVPGTSRERYPLLVDIRPGGDREVAVYPLPGVDREAFVHAAKAELLKLEAWLRENDVVQAVVMTGPDEVGLVLPFEDTELAEVMVPGDPDASAAAAQAVLFPQQEAEKGRPDASFPPETGVAVEAILFSERPPVTASGHSGLRKPMAWRGAQLHPFYNFTFGTALDPQTYPVLVAEVTPAGGGTRRKELAIFPRGGEPLSDDSIQRMQERLRQEADWLQEQGVDTVFFMQGPEEVRVAWALTDGSPFHRSALASQTDPFGWTHHVLFGIEPSFDAPDGTVTPEPVSAAGAGDDGAGGPDDSGGIPDALTRQRAERALREAKELDPEDIMSLTRPDLPLGSPGALLDDALGRLARPGKSRLEIGTINEEDLWRAIEDMNGDAFPELFAQLEAEIERAELLQRQGGALQLGVGRLTPLADAIKAVEKEFVNIQQGLQELQALAAMANSKDDGNFVLEESQRLAGNLRDLMERLTLIVEEHGLRPSDELDIDVDRPRRAEPGAPAPPGLETNPWPQPDPEAAPTTGERMTADGIAAMVDRFVENLLSREVEQLRRNIVAIESQAREGNASLSAFLARLQSEDTTGGVDGILGAYSRRGSGEAKPPTEGNHPGRRSVETLRWDLAIQAMQMLHQEDPALAERVVELAKDTMTRGGQTAPDFLPKLTPEILPAIATFSPDGEGMDRLPNTTSNALSRMLNQWKLDPDGHAELPRQLTNTINGLLGSLDALRKFSFRVVPQRVGQPRPIVRVVPELWRTDMPILDQLGETTGNFDHAVSQEPDGTLTLLEPGHELIAQLLFTGAVATLNGQSVEEVVRGFRNPGKNARQAKRYMDGIPLSTIGSLQGIFGSRLDPNLTVEAQTALGHEIAEAADALLLRASRLERYGDNSVYAGLFAIRYDPERGRIVIEPRDDVPSSGGRPGLRRHPEPDFDWPDDAEARQPQGTSGLAEGDADRPADLTFLDPETTQALVFEPEAKGLGAWVDPASGGITHTLVRSLADGRRLTFELTEDLDPHRLGKPSPKTSRVKVTLQRDAGPVSVNFMHVNHETGVASLRLRNGQTEASVAEAIRAWVEDAPHASLLPGVSLYRVLSPRGNDGAFDVSWLSGHTGAQWVENQVGLEEGVVREALRAAGVLHRERFVGADAPGWATIGKNNGFKAVEAGRYRTIRDRYRSTSLVADHAPRRATLGSLAPHQDYDRLVNSGFATLITSEQEARAERAYQRAAEEAFGGLLGLPFEQLYGALFKRYSTFLKPHDALVLTELTYLDLEYNLGIPREEFVPRSTVFPRR